MSGFFARRKDAVRQLLLREPGPAGRAVAVMQVLISLAGVALVVLAPDPTFSPLFLAFIGAIVGLFLTGSAEFVPNSAAVYRTFLRVLGLVLLTPMMVVMVASVVVRAAGA